MLNVEETHCDFYILKRIIIFILLLHDIRRKSKEFV